jgi:ferredoxin-type protein NapG
MADESKTKINRRQFFKAGAIATVSMAAIGAGASLIQKYKTDDANNKTLLRPPGAIDEDRFLYACIKCGLCVQICPIQAIELAGINEALSYGTPYMNARDQACDFSCDSLQCAETCPTAALDFEKFKNAGLAAIEAVQKQGEEALKNINPFVVQIVAMKKVTHIGVAKLNEQTCLAVQNKGFNGTPRGENFEGVLRPITKEARRAYPLKEQKYEREICDLCVTECPIGEEAITMEKITNADGSISYKPNVLKGCTGCGVCEMICPNEPASIIIEPGKTYEEVYS